VRKSNSKVDIPFTYVSTLVTHELEKQRPAPAPAAAEVATKVRPFITPINPDKYDIRL